MIFMLIPIVAVAAAGLAYTWAVTFQEVRAAKVVQRPQAVALLSVFAATMQVPLPFVMALFFIDPPNPKIKWVAEFGVLLFLIALPCALMRKGPVRWWLALSSMFFLAFTGFVYIVSQMRFF